MGASGGSGPMCGTTSLSAAIHRPQSSTTRVAVTVTIGASTSRGYGGILQADAFAGYNALYAPGWKPKPIVEAACWSMDAASSSTSPS